MPAAVQLRLKSFHSDWRKMEKNLQAIVQKNLGERLPIVGEYLASEIRRKLSTSFHSHGPSLPGGFPHARTGDLRKSVDYEADPKNMTLRVFSPLEYAEYLEHGTSKMEARPFIMQVLRESKPAIRAIMAGKRPPRPSGGE